MWDNRVSIELITTRRQDVTKNEALAYLRVAELSFQMKLDRRGPGV
jgi:hypothetical protein